MDTPTLDFSKLTTKGDIKKALTAMYQLRKQLRENLTNTKNALKDVDNIVDMLTNKLDEMEKEIKE